MKSYTGCLLCASKILQTEPKILLFANYIAHNERVMTDTCILQ